MITEEQIKKRIEICQSEIRSLLRAVEVDALNSSTGSERLMVLKQRISEKNGMIQAYLDIIDPSPRWELLYDQE